MEAPDLRELVLYVHRPEATQQIGEWLGATMKAGDVVALIGALGSGKTTFAQGMARGLGVAADRHVASPTFALVNEHPGRVPFIHADLYRIKDAAELDELGIEEDSDRGAVALEWADRFPALLPDDHLIATLVAPARATATEARVITFKATGERSRNLLAQLRPQVAEFATP